MAKRGENIYKRKDNRWEGRYLKGYSVSGKPLFGYIYAKSYQEAKKKLIEAQNFFSENKDIGKQSKKLFSDYCDEWLSLNRNHVKESTYVKYRNMLERHIKPFLGQRLPQTLNSVIIEQFSHQLLFPEEDEKTGLSPKTVKDILTLLRSILKYAQKQPGNQIPDIDIIYPKEHKREMRVLSKEEQVRLIQYLINDIDDCKFGVLFALLTGIRIGELCALRWSDISLYEKTVRIKRTMQRLQMLYPQTKQKTHISITDPKSERSNRIIPLTDYTVELCLKQKHQNSSAYVLTGKSDQFMETRALQYRLSKYTRECGLKDVHFHVLRHTFATRCVEVGFEVKSLSEILGHSSVKVTLDRYVHTSLELKRDNMNKLAAIGF